MSIISKPHGDFTNNVDVANATYVNDQMNTAYNAINGGLDYNNVPTIGNPSSLQTTAQDTLVNAVNEVNTKGTIDFMSRQALINANFDVWQRGTSFANPGNSTYTADRFSTIVSADGGVLPTTINHTRQSALDIPGSFYIYRTDYNGAGSGLGTNSVYGKSQKIENGTRYLCGTGKKVTVSFWARSSLSLKKLGLSALQRYGTGGSPSPNETLTGPIFTLTSTWTKYTATFTTNTILGKTFGTNNDDTLQIYFLEMWGSASAINYYGGGTAETFVGTGYIDIAQVQINAGDQALPFQPRSYADELALCQRYYYKTFDLNIASAQNTGSYNGALFYRSQLASTNYNGVQVNYPVRMRTAPTITFYNPAAANNKWRNLAGTDSGTPATQVSGEKGLFVDNPQVVGDAVGSAIVIHLSADAEL